MAVAEILNVIQTPPESKMHSRLLQWGRLLLALGILCFLIKRLTGLLAELEAESVSFQLFWLIASFGLLFGYRTLLVYPISTLYRSASQTEGSFRAIWTLFQLSQLGKYLPGKVGQFASIIILCRPLDISKTAAVVSTMQGLAFQCVLGFGMGVPFLARQEAKHFLHNGVASFRLTALHLIGLAVVLIALGSVFLIFIPIPRHLRLLCKGRFLKKMEFFQKGVRVIFSVTGTLRLLAVYLLLWGYFGIAFFVFVKSIHPIPFRHLLMLIGLYPLAWSIGFLSLVTPGGLGVREGFLSLLLTLCMPPATATLVALLSRVWVMSAEILLASIAWVFYCRQKRLNALNESSANP